MAQGLDSLKASITDWMSDAAKERAGSTSKRVTTGKLSELKGIKGVKEKSQAAESMGIDPEMAKKAHLYYADIVKLNSKLSRLQLEQGIEHKKAVKLLKEQRIQQLGQSKASEERLRRELKIFDMLEKQYQVQRKRALVDKTLKGVEPMIGKTSTSMLKFAATGKGGGPLESINKFLGKIPFVGKALQVLTRVLAGLGGLIIGVVIGSLNLLLSSVQKTFEQLNVAFTGGMQGILQATLMQVRDAFKILEKIPIIGSILGKIGGVIGALGELLINQFMFRMEDFVAKSRTMVMAEARTGATTSEAGASQKRMFEATKGIRGRTQEWMDALSETGTIGQAGQNLEDSFYRMGQSMMLSASQTGQYFNQMLSMSGDSTLAAKDMGHMFQVAKDATKKTTLSTIELTKAISDASMNARMLNVDTQTVANTMNMLADKQKILGQFGIDLKSQGPGMLKALTGMGKGWDMATHSFAGMLFYGKKYQEQTGKQLDIGKAYMMSRYGEEGGKAFKMGKEGTWEMGKGQEGAKAFQIGSKEMSERLQNIQQYTIEQTKHIQNDGERMMAQKMLLKDIFKINDENAQTAIMTTKKGDFRKLAASKEMKMSMMSRDEVARRTLTVQERSEQYQRMIMKLTQSVLTTLILLPFKIMDLLGNLPLMSGLKKVKPLGLGVTVEELGKGFDKSLGQVRQQLGQFAPILKNAFIDPVVKSADNAKKLSTPKTMHYGGLLRANELARMQMGEGGKLGGDEFMFMGSKPMNITPKPEMTEQLAAAGEGGASITNAGSTTHINITVPSSNPDEIADALRQHLARIS